MNFYDYLLIAGIGGAVVVAILSIRRRRKRGICCGDCSSCTGCRPKERSHF